MYGPLPSSRGNLRSQTDQLLNLKNHMNLKHEFVAMIVSMLAKLASQILPEMKQRKEKILFNNHQSYPLIADGFAELKTARG